MLWFEDDDEDDTYENMLFSIGPAWTALESSRMGNRPGPYQNTRQGEKARPA